MKQFVVVIISLVILFSASPRSTTFLIWKINQTVIAKTLCIKKEVKGNTCQGKCHLKAQLKNAKEKESPKTPIDSDLNSMPIYCVGLDDIVSFTKILIFKITKPISSQFLIDRVIVERMLRPPNPIVFS